MFIFCFNLYTDKIFTNELNIVIKFKIFIGFIYVYWLSKFNNIFYFYISFFLIDWIFYYFAILLPNAIYIYLVSYSKYLFIILLLVKYSSPIVDFNSEELKVLWICSSFSSK